MNAPANIPQRRAVRIDENQIERAHRAAISIHCPNCDEMAMASRVDLAIMRDQAGAGLRHCCDDARGILSEASRIAALTVYAPIETHRLVRLRFAVSMMMDAARALERAQR